MPVDDPYITRSRVESRLSEYLVSIFLGVFVGAKVLRHAKMSF